jgi:hypothetical protein
VTGMWACPRCGRSFASRNQAHACAAPGDLDQYFIRAAPGVRATFDAVLAAVSVPGPVQVLAEKTRIAWQVRLSFAAFPPGAGAGSGGRGQRNLRNSDSPQPIG